jgi:hypothetical protein
MAKRSKYKSIFKIILLLMAIMVCAAAILPFIYKDDIIRLIKKQSDEYLNADINFQDLDLSLLSTFPSMTIEIENLTIAGKDSFQDLKLVDLNKLTVKLDLWKIVMDGKYEVKSVLLDEPKIHVKVLANGTANYDIYKSVDTVSVEDSPQDNSSPPLEFKLKRYEINKAVIIYDDALYATTLKLEDFNHSGSFTMLGEKYLLETNTKASSFDLGYEGVNYFEKSKIDILFNGDIAFIGDDMKFVITKSLSKINQFNLVANGEFLMREDDYKMNFTVATLNQDFKSILSIVPGIYKQDFESINTNGEFEFSCLLNGIYSDSLVPGIEMNLSVNNGYFKYPDLIDPVDNINVKCNIDFPGGKNMDLLQFNLDNFSLGFINSSISSNLFATKLSSDPKIKSSFNAEINLADIARVIPLEDQEISGLISSNLNIDGTSSTIEEEKYDEFDASGKLEISDFNYSSSVIDYDINLQKLDFDFHPQKLSLNGLSLLVGRSNFLMSGEIYNYIPFVLKDDKLEGTFKVISKLIDVNQLYVDSNTDSTEVISQDTIIEYDVVNEVFSIPENIDFLFSTSVKQLIYDSLSIENIKGELIVENSKVDFKNISMNLFEGSFKAEGDYSAIAKNRARMNLNMDLTNISFDEAYLHFNSVKKYAPAVKYFDGYFSTALKMNLVLDADYFPVYEEVMADGRLNSSNITLLDNPAFKKLDKLDKNILEKNNKIKDLEVSYHIKNGLFSIDKTPAKFKDFNASFYGTTSNTQDIDYTIESELPFSLINNNIAGLTGIVSATSNIPVSIKVGGTVISPSFSTNLNLNKTDLKENIISSVKEKIEDLKDDALKEAQKKADQIINEAKNKAQLVREQSEKSASKIESEAKKQNKIAKSEIKKQVAKIKDDAMDQVKKLEAQAKSPILKIAAKKSGEKINLKAEEEAQMLESSLTKKADQAEKSAQLKADKIRKEGNDKADLLEIKAEQEANKIIEAAKNK